MNAQNPARNGSGCDVPDTQHFVAKGGNDPDSDAAAIRPEKRAHSRFPGHALTPTGVMAIRCKQFHLTYRKTAGAESRRLLAGSQ